MARMALYRSKANAKGKEDPFRVFFVMFWISARITLRSEIGARGVVTAWSIRKGHAHENGLTTEAMREHYQIPASPAGAV